MNATARSYIAGELALGDPWPWGGSGGGYDHGGNQHRPIGATFPRRIRGRGRAWWLARQAAWWTAVSAYLGVLAVLLLG